MMQARVILESIVQSVHNVVPTDVHGKANPRNWTDKGSSGEPGASAPAQ
jgi:hypothetical protein